MAIPQPVLTVDEKRPDLLQKNTHESDAHFLWFSCQGLGPDWRLLSKSGGENGYVWPNGIKTSHDVICRVNSEGQKVQCCDLIIGGGTGRQVLTDPKEGVPDFRDIPSNEWRPGNLPIALSQVPTPPGPSPWAPAHQTKLGVSFFPALGLKHHDPSRYADQLGWHRTILKPDYARIFFYLAEGPWGLVGTGHLTDQRRQDLLKAVIEDLLAAGIAPQVTVFGTSVHSSARRQQLVDQCGAVLRAYASRLFLVDAVNEPGPIGFAANPAHPYAEVREVTRQLAGMALTLARLSPASPNTLHGGVNGQRATDAQVQADVEALMAGLPTAVNCITPHWGRSPWEPHRPLGVHASGKKIINDEPIGFKSSVNAISTPSEFAKVYLDSVQAGDDGKTLHGEPGVWHGYCDTSQHPEWADNNEFARWQDVPRINEIVAALHEVRATGTYSGGTEPPPPHQEFPVFPYPDEPTYWHQNGTHGKQVKQAYKDAFDRGLRPTPDPDWDAFVWFSRPGWMIAAGQANAEQASQQIIAKLRHELGL